MSGTATYPDLDGRSVFVSGGGRGSGLRSCAGSASRAARSPSSTSIAAAGEQLVASLTAEGLAEPLFLPCDLRDIEALRAAVARPARRNGPITVLVNNAARDDRHASTR